jgi:hypothetical protein
MHSRRTTRRILIALFALGLCATPSLAAPALTVNGAAPSPTPTPPPPPPPYGGEQDLTRIPEVVDVWTQPSIAPGDLLNLHVSSPTPNYTVTIKRETYSGKIAPRVVFSEDRTDGVDQRRLITWDATTATARAPWPTTFSVETTGWAPGVYTIATSNGVDTQSAHGIFVVKTPEIQGGRPLFPLNILTMQAYNVWGGSSTYTQPRSVSISLQRPLERSLFEGEPGWVPQAAWLAWISQHVVNLQYTTDYDLSLSAPRTNPSALILGQHTEYISKIFRDWVDRASGDRGKMEIANFGTNAFYCQVRLVAGVEAGIPSEMIVYKYPGQDPMQETAPLDAAVFLRSSILNHPEGALLGAQYGTSSVGLGKRSMVISKSTPRALLKGTGLGPGSKLSGLYYLEADYLYRAARPVIIGSASYKNGRLTRTVVTVIRTGTRGARIFNAGSLVWVTGFTGAKPFGIKRASFIRLNANILDWLQIKRH